MLHLPIALSAALIGSLSLVPQQTNPASDTTNIEWVLPGQFEAAQKRAAEDRRMLLIKGISFGVDSAGAQCATKGRW